LAPAYVARLDASIPFLLLFSTCRHWRRLQQHREAYKDEHGREVDEPNEIVTEDVIGECPDLEKCKGYLRLQDMVGLVKVKESVASLLLRLQFNWQDEREGNEISQVPFLNRVFVGCPGYLCDVCVCMYSVSYIGCACEGGC